MRPLSARAAGLLAYVTLFAALVASSELPDGPGGQQEPTATTLVPAAATVCQDAQRGAPTKQFSGWWAATVSRRRGSQQQRRQGGKARAQW